jgi:hypothetical protein
MTLQPTLSSGSQRVSTTTSRLGGWYMSFANSRHRPYVMSRCSGRRREPSGLSLTRGSDGRTVASVADSRLHTQQR